MISNTKMCYFMVALSTDLINDLENIENGTRMFIMDTGKKYIYDEENQMWRDMETGELAVLTNKKFSVSITSGESEYQSGIRVVDGKVSGTLIDNNGEYSVVLHIDTGTEDVTPAPSVTIFLDGEPISGNDITLDVTDNRDTHEIVVKADGYSDYTQVIEMSGVFLKPVPVPEGGDDSNSRVGTAVVGTAIVGSDSASSDVVGTAIVGSSKTH